MVRKPLETRVTLKRLKFRVLNIVQIADDTMAKNTTFNFAIENENI
jgi:hypothetical protein